MPYSSVHNPIRWRDLAEGARSMAERLTDPTARACMLNCASSYERLAEFEEQRMIFVQEQAANAP